MRLRDLKRLTAYLASCFVGSLVAVIVFGLALTTGWILILRDHTSLRLVSVIVAGALGLYAGSLAVALLGRSDHVRRSLVFWLLFSVISFSYLFAISQVTGLFVVIGGLLGLLAGWTVKRFRGTVSQIEGVDSA